MPLRLLLIEDSEDDALLLELELRNGGFDPDLVRVDTPQKLEAALDGNTWDAVIADYNLPSFTGLDALRIIRAKGLDLPFILVSGVIGEEKAVEAMKAGAHDYILKGNFPRLAPALERELREAEVRRERRQAVEELQRANAELLAANRELDAFAYAVSHDLRAPLRAMGGFSQALVEDFGGQLHGEALVYLEQITLASRHMGGLIDGLLTLSRSTRGEMHRDLLDLSEMAGYIRDELVRLEPDRPVAWQNEPHMLVRGDARMLEVVMRNLIGNAWKYTVGTPSALIRVYTEDRAGSRWYCVADNGAGFDMRHSRRLFKPFQRLHRQDEFPGIGIGLATVQRIIHRHGGEISAVAEPGKGATFRFTLAGSGVALK